MLFQRAVKSHAKRANFLHVNLIQIGWSKQLKKSHNFHKIIFVISSLLNSIGLCKIRGCWKKSTKRYKSFFVACITHHSFYSVLSVSFEITVNDKLVFSKLKRGGFPVMKDVSMLVMVILNLSLLQKTNTQYLCILDCSSS